MGWLVANSFVAPREIACLHFSRSFHSELSSNLLQKSFSSDVAHHIQADCLKQGNVSNLVLQACSHPSAAQQKQLSIDLGFEPKRIKFWFQNKRTQDKNQRERPDLKEAYENLKRPKCVDSSVEKFQPPVQMGNINPEHERLSGWPTLRSLASKLGSVPLDISGSSSQGPSNYSLPELEMTTDLNKKESNKRKMIGMAKKAMAELTKLLESWDPFWVKSPIDGRLILDIDIYYKSFPRISRFGEFTQIESSKASGVVALNAKFLVDMFMDAEKWLDLFPTIVAKARKIEAVDTSMLGWNAGTLHLMHAKVHTLSSLVTHRDIYFLRYSKEIRPSRWVIVDISCDYYSNGHYTYLLKSWKRPSGCLIQDKFDGSSGVIWVEHVEVDDRYGANNLYKDVFSGGNAYKAERWVSTLQMSVERLQCYDRQTGGGIPMPEMRKSLMDFSHKMVKNFFAILSVSNDPIVNLALDNRGQVSISQSNESGQENGVVLAVSSSYRLPIPRETLFSFLRDEKTRYQWDVLSGNSEREIAYISCGRNLGNRISLIQESWTHNLDSFIIYNPLESSLLLESALRGQNLGNTSLLPAGYVISDDKKGNIVEGSTSTSGNRRGSILTVSVPVKTLVHMDNIPYNYVKRTSKKNTRSIVDRIKVALGCPL